MSTSIGELSVGVSLDLKKMDAGFAELDRKTKAQIKQLDAEYAKMGQGGFGFSGGAGGGGAGSRGGGSSGGNFSRSMGGSGGGSSYAARAMQKVGYQAVGYQAADVATQVGGQGIVRALGQQLPQILAFFGPYGALAGALVATAFAFRKEILGTAEAFGDVMNGSVAAISGDAADRMEAGMAERAKKEGFGSFKELAAATQGQRASNKQFQRDQFFSKQDDQGKIHIIEKEMATLEKKKRDGRLEGKIFESEKINGELAQKAAEIEALNKAIDERERAFDLKTQQQQNERWNEQQAAKKEKESEAVKRLDDVFKATEKDMYSQTLERVRGQMGSLRNPFSSGGVSGFGSASANPSIYANEGNKLLAQMLSALRSLEDSTVGAIARI